MADYGGTICCPAESSDALIYRRLFAFTPATGAVAINGETLGIITSGVSNVPAAQRPTDGHLFLGGNGWIMEWDDQFLQVQQIGGPVAVDPVGIYPTAVSWTMIGIQFTAGACWVFWVGAAFPIQRHFAVQQRDPTTFALVNQYLVDATRIPGNKRAGMVNAAGTVAFTMSTGSGLPDQNVISSYTIATDTVAAWGSFGSWTPNTGYFVQDLRVTTNDRVVALYYHMANAPTDNCRIVVFNSSGVVINDFAPTDSTKVVRHIGLSADETMVWTTQSYPDPITGDNVSTFRSYNLLTGAMVEEFSAAAEDSRGWVFEFVSDCVPVVITDDPDSQSINPGETATLTVTATGTEPITYQWYQGVSGDTSTPIPGATSASYTTGPLTTATSYWCRVSNACGTDNSTTATITIAASAGADLTLIYDTVAKRFLFDQSDKTGIWTRLEEPGAGVYNQVVGGGDGGLYEFDLDAMQDDDVDLEWDVWTPWPDAGAPRMQKQWGDLAVGLNPGGSVAGITVQPVFQDGAITPPSVVIGAGATGRSAYGVDLQSGGGVIARNCGVQFSGVMQAGDTDRPSLLWWEPSFIPKAPSIARRATDWDTLGYQGAKFVQGVVIRANTFGLDKTVTVQSDGGVSQITLTLNHDGEEQKAYPLAAAGWNPFITELIRLEGADDVDWLLLDYRFVWEPAPEQATQWETQPTSAEWPGFGSVRDIVFAYEAAAPMTLTFTSDTVNQSYTLPSTGGVYSRAYLILAPNKGKSIRFKWTTDAPARIYKRDCTVRSQAWGAGGGYQLQSLFGGPSRESGAQI